MGNILPQPPPRSINDFSFEWKDWLWFLYAKINSEGAFVDGGAIISSSDSPYAMENDDEIIFANPDAGVIRVDLLPGQAGRIVRIKNIKTGGSVDVDVYPTSPDKIQDSTLANDPNNGPFSISKGESMTFIFISTYGWALV